MLNQLSNSLTLNQIENNAIIESLITNKFVIDGHRKNGQYPVTHFGIFIDSVGNEHVVYVPAETSINSELYPYCSVNKIILTDDGLPKLSTNAVGGTLEFHRYGTLKNSVIGYNTDYNPRFGGYFKLIASLFGKPEQEFIYNIQ